MAIVVKSVSSDDAAKLQQEEATKLAASKQTSNSSKTATNNTTSDTAQKALQPPPNDDPDAINGRGQIKDVHEKMWLTQPGGAKVTIQNEKNLVAMNLVSKRVDRIISDIAKHHGLEQFGYPANASQVRYRIRSNGDLEIFNPHKAKANEDPWMSTAGAIDSAQTREIYQQTQKLASCDAQNQVYSDRFVRESDPSRQARRKGEDSNESETVRLLTAQVAQLQSSISMMQGFAMLSNKLDSVIAASHLTPPPPPSSSSSEPEVPKAPPAAPKKTIATLEAELKEKTDRAEVLAAENKKEIDEKHLIQNWMRGIEAKFKEAGYENVKEPEEDDELYDDYESYLEAQETLFELNKAIADTLGNRAYDKVLTEIAATQAELAKATEEIKEKMPGSVVTPFFKKQAELRAFLEANKGTLTGTLLAQKNALETDLTTIRKDREGSALVQEVLDLYIKTNQEHELFEKDLTIAEQIVEAEEGLDVLIKNVSSASNIENATLRIKNLKAQLPGKNAKEIVAEAQEEHRTSYAKQKQLLKNQIEQLQAKEKAAKEEAEKLAAKAKKEDEVKAAAKLRKERMTLALKVGAGIGVAAAATYATVKALRLGSNIVATGRDFVALPGAIRALTTPLRAPQGALAAATAGSLIVNSGQGTGDHLANAFIAANDASNSVADEFVAASETGAPLANALGTSDLSARLYESIIANSFTFLNGWVEMATDLANNGLENNQNVADMYEIYAF